MPVVEFPKGPMATPKEEPEAPEPDIGVADVAKNVVPIENNVEEMANFYYCDDCGSSVFHLYDDGEVQCANPRCTIIVTQLMVTEFGKDDI